MRKILTPLPMLSANLSSNLGNMPIISLLHCWNYLIHLLGPSNNCMLALLANMASCKPMAVKIVFSDYFRHPWMHLAVLFRPEDTDMRAFWSCKLTGQTTESCLHIGWQFLGMSHTAELCGRRLQGLLTTLLLHADHLALRSQTMTSRHIFRLKQELFPLIFSIAVLCIAPFRPEFG